MILSNSRPSLIEYWSEIVRAVSTRSTCSRLQVGAVILRSGRVISTGYNGAPSGMQHCVHSPGDDTPCEISVHAEANAIAFAARYGVQTQFSQMIVTHAPCLECSKLIINSGIMRLYYLTEYRSSDGLHLLEKSGLAVRKV